MKNKTRRPPLIIHPAPKQSQQDFLKTKLEADSPFTASDLSPASQSCVCTITEYREHTKSNVQLATVTYCELPLINIRI